MKNIENEETANVYKLSDYITKSTPDDINFPDIKKFELTLTELEFLIGSLEKEILNIEADNKTHYQLDLLKNLQEKLLYWIQMSEG